jgi:2Fe-2S ferredoxin
MNDQRKEISITVINAGDECVVKTYLHQYRNLMGLLNNSIYLENFGECGGQGRCATCMVKVVGLRGNANTMERNETATINKAGLADKTIRLSCQLLINEDLDGAVIEIADDEY